MAKAKKEPKEGVIVTPDSNVIDLMRKHFDKNFGKGSLITLDEDQTSSVSEWLHSGSYFIDRWVSNGYGLPYGKMVTISGKKSSGKSTIAAHIIAEGQKDGAIAVYFDTEYAFDKNRAIKLGVDANNVMFDQPDHIEQTFQKIEAVISVAAATKAKIVVVWDSVAATPTQKEMEGEAGEGGHYGEHSKVLSQGFRKLAKMVSNNRVLLFVVNQIKQDIGGYGGVTYIGKNPLDFHSHVMMEIRQQGLVKDGDTIIGIESFIKISKNRVAAPFKEGLVRIMFEDGINKPWEVLEIGKGRGEVLLEGSWNKIMQGCTTCTGVGKVDGERCSICEGSGKTPDLNYKSFYSKDISEMLTIYPELKERFLGAV